MGSKPEPFVFKLGDDVTSSVRNTLLRRGWVEQSSKYPYFHLYFKTPRHSAEERKENPHLPKSVKFNHYAKTDLITKKDCLARNMRRMLRLHGSVYGFSPETYILPRERALLAEAHARQPRVWICKPAGLSRGRNISLTQDPQTLKPTEPFVIQHYITDPYLIGGYKFDIRLYVLVPTFRPLTVYMFTRGITRFSTQRYEAGSLDNLFIHLTNASINKHSPTLLDDKEGVGTGSKWSLDRLMRYLKAQGCNINRLWSRIKSIVLLSILPIVSEIPTDKRCYEMFGYDILLDSTYKPWLIEVNSSPAMAVTTPVDRFVKYPLLNDLLDILGFPKSSASSHRQSSESSSSSSSSSSSIARRSSSSSVLKARRASTSTEAGAKTTPVPKPRTSSAKSSSKEAQSAQTAQAGSRKVVRRPRENSSAGNVASAKGVAHKSKKESAPPARDSHTATDTAPPQEQTQAADTQETAVKGELSAEQGGEPQPEQQQSEQQQPSSEPNDGQNPASSSSEAACVKEAAAVCADEGVKSEKGSEGAKETAKEEHAHEEAVDEHSEHKPLFRVSGEKRGDYERIFPFDEETEKANKLLDSSGECDAIAFQQFQQAVIKQIKSKLLKYKPIASSAKEPQTRPKAQEQPCVSEPLETA